MEFVFTGFQQVDGVRHYGFQGVAADRSRVQFTVGTDVTLLRKYAIALQDVPLLCRRFLEEQDESGRKRAVMFTEQDMRRYADTQASAREAAAQRRRPHRAPVSNKVGQAWRGPQV
jgi:hypothetical protein